MNWTTQQEVKVALAVQVIVKMIKKPKISYKTIRKNTNLDMYLSESKAEEDEEEAKEESG